MEYLGITSLVLVSCIFPRFSLLFLGPGVGILSFFSLLVLPYTTVAITVSLVSWLNHPAIVIMFWTLAVAEILTLLELLD